jgi:hypothetical protein
VLGEPSPLQDDDARSKRRGVARLVRDAHCWQAALREQMRQLCADRLSARLGRTLGERGGGVVDADIRLWRYECMPLAR